MKLKSGRNVGILEWTALILWKALKGILRFIVGYCREHYPLRFEE